MDQKLQNKINKRIEEGTFRSLSSFDGFVDFFSNDYLGLSRLKLEKSSEIEGSTGSRLISGTTKISLAAEQKLASFFEVESALIYNSGYDANVGFFSSVPQRGDTVVYDEFVHASVRDGIRMSYCNSISFKHNDVEDLSKKIEGTEGVIYVAIESLYSMDGDFAPLKEISEICTDKSVYLIVDEAHAVGVFGENGKGLVDNMGISSAVFARLITFGKAYGSHGAAILGSQELKDFLINFSRSFIYTTALPPDSYLRITQVIDNELNNLNRKKLDFVIHYFRTQLTDFTFLSDELSPIQLLIIGDIEKTKYVAQLIQNQNIAVKPIFPPTVPIGREGIRICLHAFNTKEEIDTLSQTLKAAGSTIFP